MEDTNATLIGNVLRQNEQDIDFEPIPEEKDSPLAQPVVQKSNTAGDVSAARELAQQSTEPADTITTDPAAGPEQKTKEPFSDAPEQEINAGPTDEEKQKNTEQDGEEFAMPLEHAKLMADSIIGTLNNTLLEVGGGYFVTIRKHKDFYDFEEIIQVIEEQNVKNIKRLKLDEEDKALLRPLLIHILRKKAAVMSPEKQFLMVALSILMKKAKVVMEMRAENDALVERIRDVIRKEVRAAKEEQEQDNEEHRQAGEPGGTGLNARNGSEVTEKVYEKKIQSERSISSTGLPDEVLETY